MPKPPHDPKRPDAPPRSDAPRHSARPARAGAALRPAALTAAVAGWRARRPGPAPSRLLRLGVASITAVALVTGAGVGIAVAMVPDPGPPSAFTAAQVAAPTAAAVELPEEVPDRRGAPSSTPSAAPSPSPTPEATPTPEPAPVPAPEPEPAPAPPPPPAPGPAPVPPPPPTPAPPPPPASGRPGPSNTGVPAGTQLRRYDGDIVISTPGTVIDSLDVYGLIYVDAPGVVIRRTIVHGRPVASSAALIYAGNPAAAGLVIEDVELVAAQPSPNINGIVGAGFTLRRANIHGVIDQVHITGGGVRVEASWLHDNLHYAQDPNWGGKPSHDDNVQVQAGSGIVVTGTTLSGSGNAALMVTQDAGVVAGLSFTGNWASGGGCTINVAQKARGPIGGLVITGNRFGASQFGCPMIVDAPTAAVATISGNTMESGGPAGLQRR